MKTLLCRCCAAVLLAAVAAGPASLRAAQDPSSAASASAAAAVPVTLTIAPASTGVSTRYIGICGPWGYDSKLVRDIGVNNMRVWCDLDWFEPQNDTGKEYGKLTPAAITANPNVIPWAAWDKAGARHRPLLDNVKRDGVRLYVCLRHTGPNHGPGWMANPLRTKADRDEWWQHVFATVYWLNVRNNYHVDFWEIYNEPSLPEQGWKGTEADYLDFARLTSDAINTVYVRYLKNRPRHIGGPSLHYPQVGGDGSVPNSRGWLADTLALDPLPINAVTYHNYATGPQMLDGLRFTRQRMRDAKRDHLPIWFTEWGSYDKATKEEKLDPRGNDNAAFAVRVLASLVTHSLPGEGHVEGSHYYLWQDSGYGDGILSKEHKPRTVYYALRLGIRALQGGRPVRVVTVSGSPDVSAVATTGGKTGARYLLVVNQNRAAGCTVRADLSPLLARPNGSVRTTLFRYDAAHADTREAGPTLSGPGRSVTLNLPASGAVLLEIQSK